MNETPLTLGRPPLYAFRMRAAPGARWLPLPFPNSLRHLDDWVRARLHESGAYLVSLYWLLDASSTTAGDTFIVLFEAWPRYSNTGDRGVRRWTITRSPAEVARSVREEIESHGTLAIEELSELASAFDGVDVPGEDLDRDGGMLHVSEESPE